MNVFPVNVSKREPHFYWMSIISHLTATFVFPVFVKKAPSYIVNVTSLFIKEICDNI